MFAAKTALEFRISRSSDYCVTLNALHLASSVKLMLKLKVLGLVSYVFHTTVIFCDVRLW